MPLQFSVTFSFLSVRATQLLRHFIEVLGATPQTLHNPTTFADVGLQLGLIVVGKKVKSCSSLKMSEAPLK